MNEMQKIGKNECLMLRKELEVLLQNLAKKHGIQAKTSSGRYSPTTFTLKVDFTVKENGKAITIEARAFTKLCHNHNYGLKPEDLYSKFELNGEIFTIMGLNTRAPKMPILADRDDGEHFKFSASTVALCLMKGH